jgi:hypothetical protein
MSRKLSFKLQNERALIFRRANEAFGDNANADLFGDGPPPSQKHRHAQREDGQRCGFGNGGVGVGDGCIGIE